MLHICDYGDREMMMEKWNNARDIEPESPIQCNVICKILMQDNDLRYWTKPLLSIGYLTPAGWVTIHQMNPECVNVLYWQEISMPLQIKSLLNY